MFEDLRPYVCTFESCYRLNYLFASRHEWFDHEESYHRREWYCKQCDLVSPSHQEFELHLQQHHPDLSGSANACARPILGIQQCPLCPATCASPRLRRHLGRHMQRLALLALRSHQHDNASMSDSRDHHDSEYTSDLDFRTNPSRSGEAQKLIAAESPPEPSDVTADELQTQPPQPKPAVDNSEKAPADINSPPGQEYGRTALEATVEKGHTEVVQTREVLENLGEWSVGRTSYISSTDL